MSIFGRDKDRDQHARIIDSASTGLQGLGKYSNAETGRSFGVEFSQSPASLRCENCGLFLEDGDKVVRAEFPDTVDINIEGSVFGWYHSDCAEFEGVRDIVLSRVPAEREWLKTQLFADAETVESEEKRRRQEEKRAKQRTRDANGLSGGYYDYNTGRVDLTGVEPYEELPPVEPISISEIEEARKSLAERRKAIGCVIVLVIPIILFALLSLYAHLSWNS